MNKGRWRAQGGSTAREIAFSHYWISSDIYQLGFFFLPLLQPQHPHSSLGWKGFPHTCPGAAAAGLGAPQSQGRWRGAAAAHGAPPASPLFPGPWGGGRGLVEPGSGATAGHAHGNSPNIYHYTRNKTCGETALVLGWGRAACMVGTPFTCIPLSPLCPASARSSHRALRDCSQPWHHQSRADRTRTWGAVPHPAPCGTSRNKSTAPAPPRHTEPPGKRGWALTTGWLTGWPWRGPTFPLQHKSPAAPHQELQHKVCLLQTLLPWHQQEPLTGFQPGLHPELIRSCS